MLRLAAATVLLLALLASPAGAASTARLDESTTEVRGDEGPNRIEVSGVEEGRRLAIDDPDGIVAGAGCRQETPTRASCPYIQNPTTCDGDDCGHVVEAVNVFGLGGDDDIRLGYGPAAAGWPRSHGFVDAGAGDDFVGGTPVVDYDLDGGPGDDLIDGAGYNDRLDGGGGRDLLFGGPGFDRLSDGDSTRAPDADVLDGGPCTDPRCAPAGPLEPGDAEDVISYETRRAPVFVDLRSAAPVQGQKGEGDIGRNVETAYGGHGDDHLIAGPGRSGLSGDDGDDRLEALDGDEDFLNCGGGTDIATTDRRDEQYECEALCARLDRCPRPRIVLRGFPKGRCAPRSFTATVRAKDVPGFRRLRVVHASYPGSLADTKRPRARFRVPLDGERGHHQIEIYAVGRARGRRVVVEVVVELDTCRPVPR